MTPSLLFLAAMTLVALPRQLGDVDHAPTFDRLCGKLVRSEPMPLKGRFTTTSVQQTGLSKTELLLYKRKQDSICCEHMQPVSKTMSADGGFFEFKKIATDSYWVVVRVDGRDYKMPVKYEASASPSTRCTDFVFEIQNSGTFELGKIISLEK
jgi:hypothetical protein